MSGKRHAPSPSAASDQYSHRLALSTAEGVCPTCRRSRRIISGEAFPTVEERLREAEELLLEAGTLLRDADDRALAAEGRAARADAQIAAMVAERSRK